MARTAKMKIEKRYSKFVVISNNGDELVECITFSEAAKFANNFHKARFGGREPQEL